MAVRLRTSELAFEIEGTAVIGREGDVAIADPRASRRHAQVTVTASGVQVSDLGSANGTLVNGQRITAPTNVAFGGQIAVGDTVFIVDAIPAPAPQGVAAAAQSAAPSGGAPRQQAASPSAQIQLTPVLDPNATFFADGSILEVAAFAAAAGPAAKERVPVPFPAGPTVRLPTVHGELQVPTVLMPPLTKRRPNWTFWIGLLLWIILLVILTVLAIDATP